MTALQLVERLLNDAESPKNVFRRMKVGVKRVPRADEVEYDLEADWEQEDPRGHFEDPADVEAVREHIRNRNVWGWCSAHVIARWTDDDGNVWEGDDYLGGCSYANRQDFTQQGGYYDDMKGVAYKNLVAEMVRAGFREI